MNEYQRCLCGVLFASASGADRCLSCSRETCKRCAKPMLPRGHATRHPELCRVCEDRGRREVAETMRQFEAQIRGGA